MVDLRFYGLIQGTVAVIHTVQQRGLVHRTPVGYGRNVSGHRQGRQQHDALTDAGLDGIGGLPAQLLQPDGDIHYPPCMQQTDTHGYIQFFIQHPADILAVLGAGAVLQLQQPLGAMGQLFIGGVDTRFLHDGAQMSGYLVVDEPGNGGRLLGKRFGIVIPDALPPDLHGKLTRKLHPCGTGKPQLPGPVVQPVDTHPVGHGKEEVVAAYCQSMGQIQVGMAGGVPYPAGGSVGFHLYRRIADKVVIGRPVGYQRIGGDSPLHQPGKTRGHFENGARRRADTDGPVQRGLVAVFPKEGLHLRFVHPVCKNVGVILGVGGHGLDLAGFHLHDHDSPGLSGLDILLRVLPELLVAGVVFLYALLLLQAGGLYILPEGFLADLLKVYIQRELHVHAAFGSRGRKNVHYGAGAGLFYQAGALPFGQVSGQIPFAAFFHPGHADLIGIGVTQLQQVLRWLLLRQPGKVLIKGVAYIPHIRGDLLLHIAQNLPGHLLIRIDPAAGHLCFYAHQLALAHIQLRYHRQAHVPGYQHPFIGVPAVKHRFLPDGHDLGGLLKGHIIGDLPAFAQDKVGLLCRKLRIAEAAGLHKVLLPGGNGKFAGDAKVIVIGAIVIHHDIKAVFHRAASGFDNGNGLYQGVGVTGGIHWSGLIRIPVEHDVVAVFVIGQNIAVAVADGTPAAGLIGSDLAGGSHRRLIGNGVFYGKIIEAVHQICAQKKKNKPQQSQPQVKMQTRIFHRST